MTYRDHVGMSAPLTALSRAACVAAGAALLWCAGPIGAALAHEDNGRPPQAAPASSANLQSGVVTSVGSGNLRIDGTDYPVDAHVTVSDDEGHPRELKAVVPESQVRFHVQHGHIDQLVIVLPK